MSFRYYLCLTAFWAMGISVYAQSPAPLKVQGLVLDTQGKPIAGASLLLTTPTDTTKVLAFGICDQTGRYQISIGHLPEALRLSVRALGYHPQHTSLAKQPQTINFRLKENSRMLKEIVIKAPPITQEQDTITYSTKAFADKHDRSLADILSKLPGVDVSKSGTISYQGRPINKFYIEGRDMLEGRYSLATNNLAHQAVASIQVLNKHQPIKMLQGIETSEQAAMNIVLTKPYTLGGKAELGAGFPELWQANLTGMLFSKKKQLLASLQTHNLGEQLGNQLSVLAPGMGNGDLQRIAVLQQFPNSPPIFPDSYTRFQQGVLGSVNGLLPLPKGELKFSVDYLKTQQTQPWQQRYRYFLGKDTVDYQEGSDGRYLEHWLRGKLTYERNDQQRFVHNELQLTYKADEQQEWFYLPSAQVRQQARTPLAGISNSLRIMFPWGKQLINTQSVWTLQRQPEQLRVAGSPLLAPWGLADSLQQQLATISYGKLLQQASTSSKLWGWNTSLRAEVSYQYKLLDTRLQTDQPLDLHFSNYLSSRQTQAQFSSRWRRIWGSWELNVLLPVTYLSLVLEEEARRDSRSKLLFNPSAVLRYEHPSWDISLSGRRNISFADLPQVHYGFIMTDYRSIRSQDVPIQETDTQTYTGTVAYKEPVSGFFWNLSYTYNTSQQNGMLQERIGQNGARELLLLPIDNKRQSNSLNASLSKQFFGARISAGVDVQLAEQRYTQLIGETPTLVRARNGDLKGRLRIPLFRWMTMEGNYTWMFFRNYWEQRRSDLLRQQTAQGNVHIYPGKRHYVGFINTLFRHPDLRQYYLFADVLYRYSFPVRKIDLELGVQNMLNHQHYTIWRLNGYTFSESSIPLRPLQGMVKVRFML